MENEKCVCGTCEKCKPEENCKNCCYGCCYKKCHMMKMIVPIILIIIVFSLGYCLGKMDDGNREWREDRGCKMMFSDFKGIKNFATDEATVKVLPATGTTTTQ